MAIHPTAVVDEGAEIAETAAVWHFAHVCTGARVGDRSSLGQNVYVGPQVVVGPNVRVQNNVSLYEGVVLEEDVFVGPSVVFTNVRNPRAAMPTGNYRRTVVRRGATLGANSTLVAPLEIGSWAFVAAGAVVTADVEAHQFVAGVPATAQGWVCRCGHRLGDLQVAGIEPCSNCGAGWRLEIPGLVETMRRQERAWKT